MSYAKAQISPSERYHSVPDVECHRSAMIDGGRRLAYHITNTFWTSRHDTPDSEYNRHARRQHADTGLPVSAAILELTDRGLYIISFMGRDNTRGAPGPRCEASDGGFRYILKRVLLRMRLMPLCVCRFGASLRHDTRFEGREARLMLPVADD